MQSEVQPRVDNTSGENMVGKHRVWRVWMLFRGRVWYQRCFLMKHTPSAIISESIIYSGKQQTLQGRKCESITKESELQNREAVEL